MANNNLSWKLDPATRDYILDSNGSPVQDEGLETPAFVRLRGHRFDPTVKGQGWLYAPDAAWGSDFYKTNIRHTPSDFQLLVAIADLALQPLIDQGRAISADSSLDEQSRDRVVLVTDIVDVAGQPEQLTVTPIGL